MSKARKLAELVDGTADKLIGYDSNGDVAEKTPLVSSVNGATGAVTVSVPVSSVNGATGAVTVPVHDDLAPKLRSARNDIATLALHSAVADNKAAYNLTNSFVDQFEDSSGILTNTNVTRNTSEYVSSISSTTGSEQKLEGSTTPALSTTHMSNISSDGWDPAGLISGSDASPGSNAMHITSPLSYQKGFAYHFGAQFHAAGGFILTRVRWYNFATNARLKNWRVGISLNGGSWVNQNMTGSEASTGTNTTVLIAADSNSWNTGTFDTEVTSISNTDMVRLTFHDWQASGVDAGMAEFQMYGKVITTTASATGTLISNAQTANAAQTKVSGVLLYKNNAGTTTLNTDFKLYFSCDNGTNWTQSTMTSGGTFSTGVLIAKGTEVTCTSGTSIKYKVEWANQALGTKETQLHGIGVNY
jgi:hypothetical protein